MTKLILDGERSRLRLGLAKSLLRRIQAAGIPVKTIEVDGFRISVRVDPPTIKIVAPPLAVVVICTQANHARWFMSEGLGSALIAHDLTYCAAVDANGDCIDTRLLPTLSTQHDGLTCAPYSTSALISEILELVGTYVLSSEGDSVIYRYVHAAILCFGGIQSSGLGIYPPAGMTAVGTDWSGVGEFSTQFGILVGLSQYVSAPLSPAGALLIFRRTRNRILTSQPLVSDTIDTTQFINVFFINQVSPAPTVLAKIWYSMYIIADTKDFLRVGVLFWVLESDLLVVSMSLVELTFFASGGYGATQQWIAQRQSNPGLEVDAPVIAGAPYTSVFNRIQFADADGVSVLWGLWVAAHVDPTKATAGSIRLDHIPLVNPATGEASFQYEFVKNGLGTYIFPPELLGALVRPNYAIFMRAGQPLWFLVFQQFAAPTGLDNYVLSAYIGTPWSGWAPFVLPTEGVVRDVRLLRYDVSGTDVSLEALALVETVDTVTSAKILQAMHLDTTSATGWVDAGVLQADQVPSDPALWRLAMYGDGTAAYYHPEGRIPDLPQIPVVL